MSHNQQQPGNPGGPMSFKSNPQRNKTQKWVKAPTYDYEGDEWGGYDDGYYGYDDPPPPPPSPPPPQSQAPYQQGRPRDRTNSFDRGDEARQFSAPAAPHTSSAFPVYEEQRRPSHDYGAGPRSAASGGRGSSDIPRSRSRPRDFTNPEQVPPPLSMRPGAPPMPHPHASSAPNEWFPPRKSSMRGGTAEAAAMAAEARAIAKSVTSSPVSADANDPEKPLSFIRPCDIYKRIAERRASEAEEGGRPSMDTLQKEMSPNRGLGLEPVVESRESRMLMDDQVPNMGTETRQPRNEASLGPSPRDQLPRLHVGGAQPAEHPGRPTLASRAYRDTSPTLPQLAPVSGFGDDFAQILQGGPGERSQRAPYTGENDSTPTGPGAGNVLSDATSTTVNTAGLSGPQTTFSSLQNTPTTTRAPYGNDPAAQIAAERQHNVPVDAITGQSSAGLQHQPSSGFRSAVHQAFDHEEATPLSRDNSEGHGSTGINRSDTSSTAGISPIMSRVPSAATARFQQQQRMEESVPPIAEEPSSAHTPTASRPGSGLQGQHRISRKPSPGAHSRTASGEHPSGFEHGYRRSLDPPSTGTSPARTPDIETTANRRLSTPMSAVPMTGHDMPDVVDQAAEVPEAHLEPMETPASEASDVRDLGGPAVYEPLPTVTRGRSGTNYSEREADLAATVNSSPNKDVASPGIAEAQKDSQKNFLETHSGTPRPASPFSPNARLGSPSIGTPTRGGGPDSPAKSRSRVREIADKFHQIHERRNSAASIGSNKSSWSQFSTDVPRPKRQGTGQSALAVESPVADHRTTELVELAAPWPHRPEFGREESFKPDLPGGWISAAPTPSIETPPPVNDASAMHETSPSTPTVPQGLERATSNEQIDLTPTTKKRQLQEIHSIQPSEIGPTLQRATSDEIVDLTPTRHHHTEAQPAVFATLKQHGDQLGSAFISQYGIGHQTRDFASTAPAAPVNQPETLPRAPTGAIFDQPHPMRLDSGSTDAPTSVASSVAPTPPAKETPRLTTPGSVGGAVGEYFNSVAPLRFRSREASPENQQAPLSPQRPAMSPSLSTDTGTDDLDSDRLRHEIVRSLDPIKKDEIKRESIVEDAERTQDALDAPSNERRIEQAMAPHPAAEVNSNRPGFLDTRFSWEKRDGDTLPGSKATPEPEPRSPEIKPEMAYERPRDKALHVMNPEDRVESPAEAAFPVLKESAAAEQDLTHSLVPVGTTDSLVLPITRSQELLSPETNLHPTETNRSLQDLAPSPISDDEPTSRYLPSYYAVANDDTSGSETLHAPEKTPENASSMVPGPASPSTSRPSAPIPPFRNILAMKTPDERIATYNETRDTFAGMNTGLNDWLSKMLETHPEHANLSISHTGFKAPALQASGTNTFKRGHKASPSLANFKNKFAGDAQRSTSIGSTEGTSNADSRPTRSTLGDGKGVDMEEVKAKGKEFMKNANVLGGKASQGAKSWFNKSKSRLASGSGSVRGGKNEASSPLVKSNTFALSPLPSRSALSNRTATTLPTVPDVPTAIVNSNVLPAPDATNQDSTVTSTTHINEAVEPAGAVEAVHNTSAGHQASSLPRSQSEAQHVSSSDKAISTFGINSTPGAAATSFMAETELLRTGKEDPGNTKLDGTEAAAVTEERGRDTPMVDLAVYDESREESFVSAEQEYVARDDVSGPAAVNEPDHETQQAVLTSNFVRAKSGIEKISAAAKLSADDPARTWTAMHHSDAGRNSHLQEAAPLEPTRTRSPDLAPARTAAAEFEGFGNAPMSNVAMSPTLTSPTVANTLPAGLKSPTPPTHSRQTSRSSPFRKRERSQTPSSTRTGASARPLSQAFERLKDKARSMSRSSTHAARSRPASLVFSNPNLLESRYEDQVASDVATAATADFALNDCSDVALRPGMGDHPRAQSGFSVVNVRSTERRVDSREADQPDSKEQPPARSRVMSMASPDRTEAWDEPDATIPLKTPTEEKSESPRRLGVLPSPAPTTVTFDGDRRASLEVAKRWSSAAPFTLRQSGDFGGELFSVPSADSREDEERAGRSGEPVETNSASSGLDAVQADQATVFREADLKSREERPTKPTPAQETIKGLYDGTDYPSDKEDNDPPQQTDRPRKYAGLGGVIAAAAGSPRPAQHQRKVSDIELLPSQRRNSEFNGGRPETMVFAPLTIPSDERVRAQEDVSQASPVTIKSANPQVISPGPETNITTDKAPGGQINDEDGAATNGGVHRALSTGHEKAIEKMEREIQEAAASPAAVAVPVADMKATDDDGRSEISAEGGAPDSYHNTTSPSRHSSVSSFGAQDRPAVLEQPVMTAQAVPTGPISGPLMTSQSQYVGEEVNATAHQQGAATGLAPMDYHQRFANREYAAQRSPVHERPLSYMPGPRDESGVPQEQIFTGPEQQQSEVPIDVSALAGLPAGTPPFQQHPVFRNSGIVQPTEYEKLRHSRQLSGDIFAGSVPPSKVTDQHMLMGLEDVHEYGTVSSELQRNAQQQHEQKQTRRRSGIWEALSTRRSSRIDKVDSSRESSLAPLPSSSAVPAEPPYQASEDTSKPNTLRKVQRAESSADPKKKRFSRLGSLFGRSNTSAGDSKKSNRLTKNVPPGREDSLQAQTPPTFRQGSGTVIRNVPPVESSSVTGSVRDYDAYEARRRQDLPAFQANMAHMRSVSENVQQQRTFSPGPPPAATGAVQPPPEGWYGPSSSALNRAPMPEFRRLHSSGNNSGRSKTLARVPEAFMPVDASFNRPVESIGLPPQNRPPAFRNFSSSNVQEQVPARTQASYSGASPSEHTETMMNSSRTRQLSVGPEVSQMSPQMARPFGFEGSLSPIQTRDGGQYHAPPRDHRVGLLGEEVARSPAKEYYDQQTPWSIDLPRERQGGRPMLGAEYNVEQDYDITGAPQLEQLRAPQYRQARALQQQQQRLPYTPSGQLGPPRPIPWEVEQPIRQQYTGGDGPYPNPSHSPEAPQRYGVNLPDVYPLPQPRTLQYAGQQYQNSFPPPDQQVRLQSLPPNQQQYQQYQHEARSLPQQQNRYYAQRAQPQQQHQPSAFSGSRGKRPPGGGRRTSSGYSGRRDDPAIGEEELILRGASYPGQEWDPRAGAY